MTVNKKSQAQAQKEQSQVMTFNFSESKSEIRNVFVNNEPHFIASDIAKALGYNEPHKATRRHCRYGIKHPIPHPQSPGKQLEVLVIPESDVYRLIMSSTLPSAQKFERWVMEEVLPAIRKKGYYGAIKTKGSFIDARDVPYSTQEINSFNVRSITLKGTTWVSVNDCNQAVHSSTGSFQVAKKLNARQQLAIKIWLFGNTHPAWFTNELGVQLILSGSRKLRMFNQLNLAL